MATDGSLTPRAVFGVPLYNSAGTLPEAIESLLSQTEPRLAVVLVDDCSSDATLELARRYAEHDERVVLRRNDRRLGLVGNWRHAFELAGELFPEAPYFAWASDHDVWHPRWLERVMAELERSPDAVLGYALAERIAAHGDALNLHVRPAYDSRGIEDAAKRLRGAFHGVVAGDAVYGLARVPALRAAGPFRHVVEPDRLLVRSLAVRGHLVQVPETLWFRRVTSEYSGRRQRASFFMGRPPLHGFLPPPLVHAALFTWDLAVRGAARPTVSRAGGVVLAAHYLRLGTAQQFEPPPGKTLAKRRRRGRRWVEARRDRTRRARRAAVKRVRRPARTVRRVAGRLAGRKP